jgi:hypothetical protein
MPSSIPVIASCGYKVQSSRIFGMAVPLGFEPLQPQLDSFPQSGTAGQAPSVPQLHEFVGNTLFEFVGYRIEESFPIKHLPRKFGGWL